MGKSSENLDQQATDFLHRHGINIGTGEDDAYEQKEQPVVRYRDGESEGLTLKHAGDRIRARQLRPTAGGLGNEQLEKALGSSASGYRPVEEQAESDLDQ